MLIAAILLTLIFLVGACSLTVLTSIFRSCPKGELLKLLDSKGKRFYYRFFHRACIRGEEYESLFFAVRCAQNVTRFLFISFLMLATFELLLPLEDPSLFLNALTIIVTFTLLIFLTFLIGDYIPRIIGTSKPEGSFGPSSLIASFFMILSLPIIYPFLILNRALPHSLYFDHLHEPDTLVKQEIIEIIQEAKITNKLDDNEKKLIASLLAFCDHLAKEVMVPRVDLFSLEASTSIREALKLLEEEGYSRVPIYKENIDKIVGILMYKDLLATYRQYLEKGHDPAILAAPISTIQKPPIYTPETKKISELLQEFRKKQMHMAIVVDEYGGTEGIVTIEDILEDIVGDIIDEYDDEEELFISQADGSWIVDPRMSLLDVQEQLHIKIPQEGDYDTIGGYIFHSAGEIPKRGFAISSDAFDLVVLRCTDRAIEKVRIRPSRPLEKGETAPQPDKET